MKKPNARSRDIKYRKAHKRSLKKARSKKQNREAVAARHNHHVGIMNNIMFKLKEEYLKQFRGEQ